MGTDGRRQRQGNGSAITARLGGPRGAWRFVAQRMMAAGDNDQQVLAALERYLQIPTFQRQGRRLSCR